jgi:hypothetical protein
MRSYIFTSKEKAAVHAFLRGELSITSHLLSQVRTRLKQFDRLREDVDLYVRLAEAVSTVPT